MKTVKTPLSESLLHFVWEGIYFDAQQLMTQGGERVALYKSGRLNTDQGPDFSDAHIQIGALEWWGNVEIHIDGADWYRHQHHLDPTYNTTILHVVYSPTNRPVLREDGTEIPEVVLGERIYPEIVHRYSQLQLAQTSIPCEPLSPDLPPLLRNGWLDRLAVERILHKSQGMRTRLEELHYDWDQVLWESLASMMGGPVNKAAFQALAEGLSFSIIQRYRHAAIALEALCMGFAGWLRKSPKKGMEQPEHPDHYYHLLYSEWQFLREKHHLADRSPIPFHLHRMRPASFPTLRLSQLIHLIQQPTRLIDLCLPDQLPNFLQREIHSSSYWDSHYFFFESHTHKKKRMGQLQKHLLLINVLVPFAWIYWEHHGRSHFEEELTGVLTQLPPEDNKLIRKFANSLGKPRDAFHSQGMIHLYKQYCSSKKCLECAIGHHLLGKE